MKRIPDSVSEKIEHHLCSPVKQKIDVGSFPVEISKDTQSLVDASGDAATRETKIGLDNE